MTALQPYQPAEVIALRAPKAGSMAEWVDEFTAVAQISAQIARTNFCPLSLHVYRRVNGQEVFDPEATTAQVAAVLMTGQELGIGRMAALRNVDVINGTPALRALALRGLVLMHGHRIWVVESSDSKATVTGVRKGTSDEQSMTWTMDMARARNLASKPNWRTQPRNMLIARATAEVARLIAADALLGLPYVDVELEDGDVLPPAAEDMAPPGPRRAQRPRRTSIPPTPAPMPDEPVIEPAPAPERVAPAAPDPDEPNPDQPAPDPDAGDGPPIDLTPSVLLTEGQRRRIMQLTRQLGYNSDERLQFAQETAGRFNFTDLATLFSTEAAEIITALMERLRERDQGTEPTLSDG